MYRTILIAYDGSAGAKSALDAAVDLADTSSVELHLVRSTGELSPSGSEQVMPLAADALADAEKALRRAVSEMSNDPPIAVHAIGGNPIAGIIQVAEEVGADLLVVGSRGRAMMPEAVLGRVSSGVASDAPCDVLVVQPRS